MKLWRRDHEGGLVLTTPGAVALTLVVWAAIITITVWRIV